MQAYQAITSFFGASSTEYAYVLRNPDWETNNDLDCQGEDVIRAIRKGGDTAILEEASPDALGWIGLNYFEGRCSSSDGTKIYDSERMEAAEQCFKRAATKYQEQGKSDRVETALKYALRSVNNMGQYGDFTKLSVSLKKIEIFEQMKMLQVENAPDASKKIIQLDQKLYEESKNVYEIYERQSNLISHQIYPRGSVVPPAEERSFLPKPRAKVKQAHFLAKVASLTMDIDTKLERYEKAKAILEEVRDACESCFKDEDGEGELRSIQDQLDVLHQTTQPISQENRNWQKIEKELYKIS